MVMPRLTLRYRPVDNSLPPPPPKTVNKMLNTGPLIYTDTFPMLKMRVKSPLNA